MLLTPAGYFVKSLETGGIKHGVRGQSHYGYLEGVANADAVALRVVDDKTAESIYDQIASFPEIRPFDFLLTNAPGLDDTYWSWGNVAGKEMGGIYKFGCWVNGGVWGTVEGRAILMYYRLGKFDDIYRSAVRAMKWAKDFRMDGPFTQQGENTYNNWYEDDGWTSSKGVAIMADNFGIPAATVRGLFDYDYKCDRLILRPRIPGSITEFTQKQPVRFGTKKIYLSCRNDGPKIKSYKINGKPVKVESSNEVVLIYDQLPVEATIEITTYGGWAKELINPPYPITPPLISENVEITFSPSELPDSLQKQFDILSRMGKILAVDKTAEYDHALIITARKSFEAYQYRTKMENVGPGYFRPIDHRREEVINRLYARTALGLFKGFKLRMENYAKIGDDHQKYIASLFFKTLK